MEDYEKPGRFYLGRKYDLGSKELGEPILYDSKDLVTHAVCVGMTGSGKTGLCIGLLEEAALDGIPSIAIDPKGDLVDLLLAFPELRPEDFQPWVNTEEATKQGVTIEEFARQQAERWREGLAQWDQDPSRIRRLKEAADFVIYTPGSSAGLPVSILKSLGAPPPVVREDEEALHDRINTAVTSLLGLVGIAADPVQSREHVLLSNLFMTAWSTGQDLDLARLVQQVQEPPFRQLGVLDLESFYPAKERAQLALMLNNLLAAPTFQSWLAGEPLDIGSLLRTSEGKPRVSIFSIAHLSEPERMFFVSMLLNELLGWMWAQPGTGSLRAIIYMDEIFGFFPPVAEPPSKRPLLTLLKQARAFGVGILLATQNPVDLDYKGLANAGTWFIGRLQTERDKSRLLEGLEGVAAGTEPRFDRQKMEETLAGLGKRVFLLYNVHAPEPVTFQTRWTLSYLAGPLTRAQIKRLMDPRRQAAAEVSAAARVSAAAGVSAAAATASPALPSSEASVAPQEPGEAVTASAPQAALQTTTARPKLPPEVPQYFLPVRGALQPDSNLVYRPAVLAAATVNFVSTTSGKSYPVRIRRIAETPETALALDWDRATELEIALEDLDREPHPGGTFLPPPTAMTKVGSYRSWGADFADWVFRTQTLELLKSNQLKVTSEPGESEEEFRAHLRELAQKQAEKETEKVRNQFATKKAALEQRILRAEQARARELEQARGRKLQTAISFGATVMSMLLGRKKLSTGTLGRATTAMRDVGRSIDQNGDVKRAEETLTVLKQKLADLVAEEEAALNAVLSHVDGTLEELEKVLMRPRKSDITVDWLGVVWMPYWTSAASQTAGLAAAATPAWQ